MREGRLPAQAVCVTFDDGYVDNLQLALPVLQRWNIPAMVFVSTDFMDGSSMWNDRLIEALRSLLAKGSSSVDLKGWGLDRFLCGSIEECYLSIEQLLTSIKYWRPRERLAVVEALELMASVRPPELMMSREKVLDLYSKGVSIGAHTQSHPILTSLSGTESEREIGNSKHILESLLQTRVDYFAYPNGRAGYDYEEQQLQQIKSLGFKAALSTNPGAAHNGSDVFQLPRFTPWGKETVKFIFQMIRNRYHIT